MDRAHRGLNSLQPVSTALQNKVGGGEGLEGCYGSITQTGVSEVYAALKEHAGLGKDSVLVDVGSGLGRCACMHRGRLCGSPCSSLAHDLVVRCNGPHVLHHKQLHRCSH